MIILAQLLLAVSSAAQLATLPKIIASNGNLQFNSAGNNISFTTQNRGQITFNGVPLSILAQQNNPALKSLIDNVTRRVDLLEYWQSLQPSNTDGFQTQLNGTSFSVPTDDTMVRRVNSLQNSIADLKKQLATDNCSFLKPCRNGATCQNSYDGYRCTCPTGWRGSSCEADFDECSLQNSSSHLYCGALSSKCYNTPGSYKCECNTGFVGSNCRLPVTIGNHTETASFSVDSLCQSAAQQLCSNGLCLNRDVSSHLPAYLLNLGPLDLEIERYQDLMTLYANKYGYSCLCDAGWHNTGSPAVNPSCTDDTDECAHFYHQLLLNSTTSNTSVQGGNQSQVSIVDYPCSLDPFVECINKPGTFTCGSCPAGFQGDGYSCVDINECLVNNGGCNSNPPVECINLPGSYRCGACPVGYAGDGTYCDYIGACSVQNGGCHPLAACRPAATVRGVMCQCPAGYAGDGIGYSGCQIATHDETCSAIEAVYNSSICLNGGSCLLLANGNFRCICASGFEGLRCETDRNECASNPCLNDGTCIDKPNAYECRCTTAFTGLQCESRVLECGGVRSGYSGTVQYPLLDDQSVASFSQYNHNSDCQWTIEVPEDSSVVFNFTKLDLETHSNCQYDYVQIVPSEASDNAPTRTYCGSLLSYTQTDRTFSYDNVARIKVRFVSDSSISGKGFELTYVVVSSTESQTQLNRCGADWSNKKIKSIDRNQVVVINSVNDYSFTNLSSSQRCLYRMSTEPGLVLQFQLQLLDTSGLAAFCNYSVASSATGNTTYSKLNVRIIEPYGFLLDLCRNWSSAPRNRVSVVSRTSFVVVHYIYTASAFVKYQLVVQAVNAPCGGRIKNSRSGVVEFPSITQHYSNSESQMCIWTVSGDVLVGMNYTIKFTNLSLVTTQPNSNWSNVQVMPSAYRRTSSPCLLNAAYTLEIRSGEFWNSRGLGIVCMNTPLPGSAVYDVLGSLYGQSLTSAARAPVFSIVYQSRAEPWRLTFAMRYSMNCNRTLGGVRGEFVSPNYPLGFGFDTIQEDVDCYFTILSAGPDQVVQLRFVDFNIEPTSGCLQDFVEVIEEFNQVRSTTRLCGFTLNDGLSTLTQALLAGSGPTPSSIIGRSESARNVNEGATRMISAGLLRSRADKIVLRYRAKRRPDSRTKGIKVAYTSVMRDCGGLLTDPTGQIRSPDLQNFTGSVVNCVWIVRAPPKYRVLIKVNEFSLYDSYDCQYDSLDVVDLNTTLIGRFCGSQIPRFITSFNSLVLIRLRTRRYLSTARFNLEYQFVPRQQTCNKYFAQSSAVLQSPLYPKGYAAELDCVTIVHLPEVDQQILIRFLDFELEQSANCSKDYLELRNGGSEQAPLIGRFCGSGLQFNHSRILTYSNQLYVLFHTDQFANGRGYRLVYESVTSQCGGILHQPQGSITSPGYPIGYPGQIECRWQIVTNPGNQLSLQFQDFELESPVTGYGCLYDYVQIVDSSSAGPGKALQVNLANVSASTVSYCELMLRGVVLTPPISVNAITIKFRSDFSLHYRGFLASYWSSCAGVAIALDTGDEGVIESLGYPIDIASSAASEGINACDWSISSRATIGAFIETELNDFRFNDLLSSTVGTSQVRQHVSNRFMTAILANCTSTGDYFLIYDGYANVEALNVTRVLFLFCSFAEDDAVDNAMLLSMIGAPFIAYLNPRFALQRTLRLQSSGTKMQIRSSFSQRGRVFYRLTYRAAGCGGSVTVKSSGLLQSPSYPSTYTSMLANWTALNGGSDAILECNWQLYLSSEFGAMQITLQDVDMMFDSPPCATNSLQLFGGTRFDDRMQYWCNKSAALTFTSSAPVIRFRFIVNMTASMANNSLRSPVLPRGVSLQYQPAAAGCVYRYIGVRNVQVFSPNYPGTYGNNLDCYVYFETADANELVELEFFRLDVETTVTSPGTNWSTDCAYDFLSIYDGFNMSVSSVVAARLCGAFSGNGTGERLVFRTKFSNKMLVRFRTDASIQFTGFRATFRAACGGHYQLSAQTWTSAGEIRSPNYPRSYPANADCTWFLETLSSDMRITVTLSHLDLEASANCSNDYLALYNGLDEQSPPLITADNSSARLCGSQIPRQASSTSLIMSGSQFLLIRFRSNAMVERTGFKIVYHPVETACGAELHQSEGDLISPHYPDPGYPSLIDCEWLIVSPPGSRIELTFLDFRLESGTNDTLCQKDHVEIFSNADQYEYYDRLNVSSFQTRVSKQLVGRYCDLVRPPRTLSTTRNVVWIKLSSDEQRSAPGFLLSFRTVYDSQISNVAQGFLASPSYPYLYPPGVTRQWRLLAPANFLVRFRLIAVDLEPSTGAGNEDCLVDGRTTQSMGVNRDYVAFVRGRNTLIRGYRCMPNYQDSVFETDQPPITVVFYSNQNAQGGTGFLLQWAIMDQNASASTPLFPSTSSSATPTSCAGQIVALRLDDDYLFTNQSDVFPAPAVPRILIQSPGYPNRYSNNLDCDWTLQFREPATNAPVQLGYRYWLNLTDLDLEENEYCAWDWINVAQTDIAGRGDASWLMWYLARSSGAFPNTADSPSLRVCHRRQRAFPVFPTRTLSEPMTVRFHSDYSVTGRGFELEVRPTCGGLLTRDFGSISVPTTLFSSSETPSLNSPVNFLINCTWVISSLLPQSRVEVLFEDVYLPGSTDCSQTCLSANDGYWLNSPSLLGNYTQSNCICTQAQASQLQFRRLTSASREIIIRFQFFRNSNEWPRLLLQYRRVVNTTSTQQASCGGIFYVISANYLHHYASLPQDISGPGFSADSRNLTSPGYPGNYGNNVDCEWSLVALPPTRRLKLEVLDLEMESHWASCREYDSLDVFAGQTLVGRYCGTVDRRPQRNMYPTLLYSTNNQLRVQFHSDYSINGRGFLLRVSAVTCGGAYSLSANQSVILSSPNFGSQATYEAGLDCVWLVNTEVGLQLRVEAMDMKLEYLSSVQEMLSNASLCTARNDDRVEIRRDGGSGPLIRSWCGFLYTMPPAIDSEARQLALRFVTNNVRRYPELGFRVRVTAMEHVCGGDILIDPTNPTGSITSPAYPHNYPSSILCTWTVTVASLDQRIRIFVDDLNMPYSQQCDDALLVSNGAIEEAPVIARLCGSSATTSNASRTFTTTSNQLRVQFRSNADESVGRGFSLQYSLVDFSSLAPSRQCGGEIALTDFVGYSGAPSSFVLASPVNNQSSLYEANLLCVWFLSVADASLRNQTVNVQLRNFSLQPGASSSSSSSSQAATSGADLKEEYAGDSCTYDFLEIREGGDDVLSSRFIARLCGRFASWPQPKQQLLGRMLFNSASQRLWFVFKTDAWYSETGFRIELLLHACGADLGSLQESEFDVLNMRVYSTSESCLLTARGVADRIARVSVRLFAPTNRLNSTSVAAARQVCSGTGNQTLNHYTVLSQGDQRLVLFNPALKSYCTPASASSVADDSQYSLVDSVQLQLPVGRVLRIEQYGPNSSVSAVYGDWYLQVQYQLVDLQTDPCGGHAYYLHQMEGLIQSPGFPQRYANNLDCSWVILTKAGYFLEFFFANASSFDVEYSADCSNDFLEMNNFLQPSAASSADATSSVGKFCGFDAAMSRIPPFIAAHSWNDRSMIRFRTNDQITRRGFSLSWRSRCGAFIANNGTSARSGSITSPNYPRNYVNRLNCSYVFQLAPARRPSPYGVVYPNVSVEYVVTLVLSAFDVESANANWWGWYPPSLQNNCPFDYMQVLHASRIAGSWTPTNTGSNASAFYTSIPVPNDSTNQPALYNVTRSSARYCGSLPRSASDEARTLKFVSNSEFLVLRFVTDDSVVLPGFSVQYSVENCGGILDSELFGEIKMGMYHDNANCSWLVVVPSGFAIRFRVLQLDLEFHYSCSYDWLAFYNSSVIDGSRRVALLCSQQQSGSAIYDDRRRRLVTGNVALVHFVTDSSVSRNGFALSYSMTYSALQGCGADIVVTNENYAYIDSPVLNSLNSRYNLSLPDLDCLWKLSLPPGANESSIATLEVIVEQFTPITTAQQSFANCSTVGQSFIEVKGRESTVPQRYCTGRSAANISMQSSAVSMRFVVEDGQQDFTFRVKYRLIRNPCGRQVQVGSFSSSPVYSQFDATQIATWQPSVFPLCSWSFAMTDPVLRRVTVFELNIDSLAFGGSSNSTCDARSLLRISDVSQNLARSVMLCQNRPVLVNYPIYFESLTPAVSMRFQAPDSVRSFSLSYRAINVCNRTLVRDAGQLSSVNWRVKEYLASLDCYIHVAAPSAAGNSKSLSITFDHFDIESSSGAEQIVNGTIIQPCTYDFVEIYALNNYQTDSYSQTNAQIAAGSLQNRLAGRYCGSSVPSPLFLANVNYFVLRFHTDDVIQLSGYLLNYAFQNSNELTGCGWSLQSTFDGLITSPAFPYTSVITQPINCSWQVAMPSHLATYALTLAVFNFPRSNFTADENCTNVNTVLRVTAFDQNGLPIPNYGNRTGSVVYCNGADSFALPWQQNTLASRLLINFVHTPSTASSGLPYSGFRLHYMAALL